MTLSQKLKLRRQKRFWFYWIRFTRCCENSNFRKRLAKLYSCDPKGNIGWRKADIKPSGNLSRGFWARRSGGNWDFKLRSYFILITTLSVFLWFITRLYFVEALPGPIFHRTILDWIKNLNIPIGWFWLLTFLAVNFKWCMYNIQKISRRKCK